MNKTFSYVTEEKTAAELAAISHRHCSVLGGISTAQHKNNKLESTQSIILCIYSIYVTLSVKSRLKSQHLIMR